MIDETLSKLIEFLESASPLVWQTLIKQVYLEAFSKLVWGIAILVVALVLYRFANLHKKAYEEKWDDGRYFQDGDPWIIYTAISLVGLWAFYLLVAAAMWFINPEFYAIRFLLEKVTGN
jgi:hypothetical protein